MPLIEYNQHQEPEEVGVYACRIPGTVPGLLEDLFLLWSQNQWWFYGSDQRYRGEVIGWVGPLQRRMG
jgi:hypothetical protein